jgi:CheY-like chemotaxis protein
MDMAEFLRECGYRVYEAATAKEAIEPLQAKFVVDFVFTDINLPDDMNGLELGEWTLRERRGVKVLVTPRRRSTLPKPSDLSWLSHTRAAICSTGYDRR